MSTDAPAPQVLVTLDHCLLLSREMVDYHVAQTYTDPATDVVYKSMILKLG